VCQAEAALAGGQCAGTVERGLADQLGVRTAAGTARRSSTRDSVLASSTDTPIHRLAGQPSLPATFGSLDDRLVSA
jgi:hypothetical protein